MAKEKSKSLFVGNKNLWVGEILGEVSPTQVALQRGKVSSL